MKTLTIDSDTEHDCIDDELWIEAIRLKISKLVESTFDDVLDSDELSKSDRSKIFERLNTIDGLARQEKVNFDDIICETCELASDGVQLLRDERSKKVLEKLQTLYSNCAGYSRESQNLHSADSVMKTQVCSEGRNREAVSLVGAG